MICSYKIELEGKAKVTHSTLSNKGNVFHIEKMINSSEALGKILT